MIIGFGQIENEYRTEFFKQIENFIIEQLAQGNNGGYFSSEIIGAVKLFVSELDIEARQQSKDYKTATSYPDRYSDQYSKVLGDGGDIAVIVDFSHINRRHALSPDGWAMLQVKETQSFDSYDLSKLAQNRVS